MLRINRRRNQRFHFSPLRYPGGKAFLLAFFDRTIRKNHLHDLTYVEPFAGGAGVALGLLLLEKVDRIVINDFDKAIYSFWRSVVHESDRFINRLKSTPVSVREWRRQKEIYKSPGSSTFDLGFATFFLNRTNVSGILDGGPIGGLDQSGSWKINARYNKVTLENRILQIGLYSNRISVHNEDGSSLIKRFLKRKNTLIYLDPPYYDKGASLYLNHYVNGDHKCLARRLNQNADSYWLLTYDDKKQIRSLYPERRISNFSLTYNAYEVRKGNEILISSDAVKL